MELINQLSILILPLLIGFIFIYALIKKTNMYEAFVDGAKDGINCAVSIIPYLLAIIVAISMLQASGVFEFISGKFKVVFDFLNLPCDIFPLMIIRSLSGSALLGLVADIADKFGNNAYITKLAAIMAGSSETTFYVISVYFGAVGIKKVRYALICGLFADFVGIVSAIFITNMFFG